MHGTQRVLLAGLALIALGAVEAQAGDEHWSRQFKKPAQSTAMGAETGMSDGTGKPRFRRAKWHDGKLWMAGHWEAGASALDTTKRQLNEAWSLWTWSPSEGYQPVCWFHTSQGGRGPDGQIYDFVWLPDGRMVIAGAFTRLDNPGGTRYHRVNALAVYDPNEPTANKWQPLGSFQYNGTVSEGGIIESLAYDPQGNDLYLGGTFGGIGGGNSPFFHRYDFDTNSYEPIPPGVRGQKPIVHRLLVDTTTKPSTVYLAGKFHHTAGNGLTPGAVSTSTDRFSTGLASFQLGVGWRTFPSGEKGALKQDEEVLQRAADFMFFDSVNVHDVHVEPNPGGKPDIWIAGSFSEGKGTGQKLRGLARWDWDKEVWTDPTGKGGIGRECWSIGKADNGKLYFAGAFGGRRGKDQFIEGFKDGTPAAMAISYDPKTNTWEQLGSGLSSLVFPECRLTVNGNDVYFVGDFEYIGPQNEGKKEWESAYVARWNETIDFTKDAPETGKGNTQLALPKPTQPLSPGNEHWSRGFPAPPRRTRPDQPVHTASTGMDIGQGTPDVRSMVWLGDTLYFAGNYMVSTNERWYVWSYHPEKGWAGVAYEKRNEKVGPCSIPSKVRAHEGKLWMSGSLESYKGMAIYDPATQQWSKLEGTFQGKPVVGHAVEQGGGTVHDFDWDPHTGDLILVGVASLEDPKLEYPKAVAAVIRVDPKGEYHPMGQMFGVEDPGKPFKVVESLYIDSSVKPSAIYVGGTFAYWGGTTGNNSNLAYNIARWDHEAQDWRPVGKGGKSREIDKRYYPDGLYPGLPTRPGSFLGFLDTMWVHVRTITSDAQGNLYAGGCLAVVDQDTLPVKDRKETFGIAKLDKETGRWGPCTTVGGVSRDVLEMSWLDEDRTQLLLTGAFEYDNAWNPVSGVALLDTTTGELKSLGGGLMRAARDQVVAPMIRHAIRGSELWFAGLFDHAGINANDPLQAPIESWYVAMYDPTKSMDPNAGLTVEPVAPFVAKNKYGSTMAPVKLQAKFDGEGTVTWYERRLNGSYNKVGQGLTCTVNARAKGTDSELMFYVCVVRPDGSEGGKIPVRVPVVGP